MDQIEIGKFIAGRRKAVGLTQLQLAEKLNITDRAISKWECGRAMPDSSIMLELCDILEITVNDLLCGQVVKMDNYSKELEKNLIEMIERKETGDRLLLIVEWIIGILSILVLFIPIIIGAILPMEEWQRVVLCFSGFIPCFIGFFFAVRIEQIAGYYKCGLCGHRYVPTYKAVNLSMHLGRTRYMTCPKCQKKSWHKKVLSKNEENSK